MQVSHPGHSMKKVNISLNCISLCRAMFQQNGTFDQFNLWTRSRPPNQGHCLNVAHNPTDAILLVDGIQGLYSLI